VRYILILITIVCINPYRGIGIDFDQETSVLYTYDAEYQSIEITEPEENEAEKKQQEKINRIIESYYNPLGNYPPYL